MRSGIDVEREGERERGTEREGEREEVCLTRSIKQ